MRKFKALFFLIITLGVFTLNAQFTNSGTNLYTNGNVAIGNTPINTKLFVKGTDSYSAAIFETTHKYGLFDGVVSKTSVGLNTTSNYRRSLFKAEFTSAVGGYAYTTFRAGELKHSVDAFGNGYFSGKVGIGTTLPQSTIHIRNTADGSGVFSGIRMEPASSTDGIHNIIGFRCQGLRLGGGQNSNFTRSEILLQDRGISFGTNPSATAGSLMTERMVILSNGNIGIGTTTIPSGYKLAVKGKILTEGVKVSVNSTDWSDFVFADSYTLRPLEEVETFIKENKHLPEVPSAEQVGEQGIDLAKMDAVLLQKIEELTLYIIDIQKTNNETVKSLEKKNCELEKRIIELELQ